MAFSKKVALRPLFYLLIALFFGYLCYHSLAGDTILCASVYDGFFFFAANPIYTLALCCFVQRIWRKTITLAELGYLAMLCGSIVLFCLHKTMGGWQFGARYLVDSIPYL